MIAIYKITNTLNNKIYIGSSLNFNKRIRKHKNDLKNNKHHNIKLQRSFNKYGDIFKYDLIEECLETTLLLKEQYYINELKPEYNIHLLVGGHNRKLTTEETKLKISKSKEQFMKKVYKFDLNNNLISIYKSLSEASKSVSKNSVSKIIEVCKGTRNQAYGFKWSYTELIIPYQKPSIQRTIIIQYDLNNVFIKEWDSITELSEFLNISNGAVINYIRSKVKTRNKYLQNFIWKEK